MSLCDTCKDPGACCRMMAVTGPASPGGGSVGGAATLMEAQAWASGHGMPFFRPFVGKDDDGSRLIRFTCARLGPDGRCTAYDDRPNVCRQFEPASDRLCVHYTGEKGEA